MAKEQRVGTFVNFGHMSYFNQEVLTIALDKSGYQVNIFSQKHVEGTEALLMSTHNISFCGEIRKISVLLD